MPNKLQLRGTNKRLPPATPEAPQADKAATTLKINAVGKSTLIPNVCVAARVKMVIVIAMVFLINNGSLKTHN